MLYSPSLPPSSAPWLPVISRELQSLPKQPASGILRITEPAQSTQGRSWGGCVLFSISEPEVGYFLQSSGMRPSLKFQGNAEKTSWV